MPSFMNSATYDDLMCLKTEVREEDHALSGRLMELEYKMDLLLKHLELEVDTKPRLRKIEDLLDKEQCSEKV